ncbi:MAG: hypothetical protein C7B45_13155 [Sulfobacillus acidophilus]|uniref:Glycosyltransferase 2-like domain-containing protein n=1 Tax=Sulfobacillus acidophilus TaxID=53633 RepID=A0A2T2WF10_9FIRM|nr:MAG: hypothetical protein C7B45_13155 [Sulfobacillus acidophilus]
MKRFQLPSPITVVVRTNANAGYLPQCLESLLEQSQAPQQIVLLGPLRSNLPSAVLPFLRYVTCVDEQAFDAWTQVSDQIRTPYLMPLTAHDELSPTALEALELVLDVRKGTGLVRAQFFGHTATPKINNRVATVETPLSLLRRAAMRDSASLQQVFRCWANRQESALLQSPWSIFTVPHTLAWRHLRSDQPGRMAMTASLDR